MEILMDALKVASSNSGNVFHRDGRPINAGDVRRAHDSICKKANIENFTFHDFRHTCINNWTKEGHDYFRIMSCSGHTTVGIFRLYNLVDERELKTLVNGKDDQEMEKTPESPPQYPLPQSSVDFNTLAS
jgi:integrase